MQEFIKKIVAIQSSLNAPKNQYNSFGKYKYRSCEDILEALKPLLSQYGLVQTITDSVEFLGDRYYIKASVVVTDGVNRIENAAMAREEESKKGMDASQLTGATSSYARKYALNGMWCIDDSKDADTNEHTAQTNNQPASHKQAQPNQSSGKIDRSQLSALKNAIVNKGYGVKSVCESWEIGSLAEIEKNKLRLKEAESNVKRQQKEMVARQQLLIANGGNLPQDAAMAVGDNGGN